MSKGLLMTGTVYVATSVRQAVLRYGINDAVPDGTARHYQTGYLGSIENHKATFQHTAVDSISETDGIPDFEVNSDTWSRLLKKMIRVYSTPYVPFKNFVASDPIIP